MHFSVRETILRLLTGLFIAATLSGCAQFQAMRTDGNRPDSGAHAASAKLVDFVIPADALGARDARLTEVLAKVGALAARQTQPTTIVVAALSQDFSYLNQSVRRGMPAQRAAAVHIENMTVGSGQPYSVQVKPTE